MQSDEAHEPLLSDSWVRDVCRVVTHLVTGLKLRSPKSTKLIANKLCTDPHSSKCTNSTDPLNFNLKQVKLSLTQ